MKGEAKKMNNDNRRDQKPEGGIAKLVIFAVAAFIVFIDAIGIDGSSIFFIILMIGVVIVVAVAIKKQQADAKDEASDAENAAHERAEPAKREFKPQHFDMSKFVGKREGGESLSKRLTEKMRDDLSRCDDDHEHVEPTISGTADEKRAAQLKELMRNGLIEKDEYNILMRKFGLK